MEMLKGVIANLDDMKRIILRRSKIEEWVEEPFFIKTIKNTFVKIGFSK